MTPETALETIRQVLESFTSPGLHVIRIPEGIAVLEMNGEHVLIRADRMTLEVAS